jgi:hypothetical protein
MLIIVLTLATALIHGIVLNLRMGRLDPPFTLNALGFLALLAALFFVKVPFLAGREALLHYTYIGFTAVTIVAYFAIQGAAAFSDLLGLFTKAVEVALIAALWMHLRATRA